MRSLKQSLRSKAIVIMMGFFMALPSVSFASNVTQRPTGLEMTADVLLVRPLMFVGTVLGTGIFVVSLPFSALGGNVGEAADTLVVTPFKGTFIRCLGCSKTNDTN